MIDITQANGLIQLAGTWNPAPVLPGNLETASIDVAAPAI